MTIIQVCVGSACHLRGSYNVISALQEQINRHKVGNQVEIKSLFCLDQCSQAVSVKIENEEPIYSLSEKEVEGFFAEHIATRLRD